MMKKKCMILKPEQCERAEAFAQKYGVFRLLTDRTALAFCYGAFLFLYEIPLLQNLLSPIHLALMAWTVALTVYDVAVRRLWERLPGWKVLLLFVVASGITALLNRQAGLVTNVKGWVLAVLPLAAFLPLCLTEGKDREKTLLKALSGGAAVLLLASVVAIVMYLLRISGQIRLFGHVYALGYRYYIPGDPNSGILLYGLYADPNFASAYAVVIAAYSLWLLSACRRGLVTGKKRRVAKVFAIANLAVQAVYFPLANSRGGWLCLMVAGLLCGTLYGFCTKLRTENKRKRAALSLGAAVLVTALLCGGLLLVRSGMSLVSRGIHYTSEQKLGLEGFSGDAADVIGLEDGSKNGDGADSAVDSFQKTDDGFGAGRLIIWKEALQLYTHKPILGVGPNNGTYYAKLYGFGERLRDGFSLHNSYLDVLVYFGTVGFLLLMGYLMGCAVAVLRLLFREGRQLNESCHLAVFCTVFLLGVSAFLSCCFINTTAMYYLMLCCVSYLLAQTRKDVKK